MTVLKSKTQKNVNENNSNHLGARTRQFSPFPAGRTVTGPVT